VFHGYFTLDSEYGAPNHGLTFLFGTQARVGCWRCLDFFLPPALDAVVQGMAVNGNMKVQAMVDLLMLRTAQATLSRWNKVLTARVPGEIADMAAHAVLGVYVCPTRYPPIPYFAAEENTGSAGNLQ
jgi:hypothetical protein